MIINTCVTANSFENQYWLKVFNQLHEDLDLKALKREKKPIPFLIKKYWDCIWEKNGNIGKEFLNPSNIKDRDLQRIWEYTQIVASIKFLSKDNLHGKHILSLGAGFEPCLFTLNKMGANVCASDIYYSKKYWHANMVKYIKTNPEIFCHYKSFIPNIKYVNLDLKNKKEISNIGKFDIIYSVSSLEHIFTSWKKKRKLFKQIVSHLKKNGIFSFSTELIIRYDKTRRYRIFLRNFFRKLRNSLNSFTQNDINQKSNLKKRKKKNSNIFDIKDLKNQLSPISIKLILSKIVLSHRYNRRYDFFTPEELKKLIKIFAKKGIYLVEKIHWESCLENIVKSSSLKNQYRASIALSFKKK